MNQVIQIQTQEGQHGRLEKANFLVANNKIRRSPCADSRNIWMVSSYSTAKKWYVVRWNEELDGFICGCKAFEYSSDNICLHILACSIFEGTEE
jgi:hypothetical protein